MCSSGIIIRKTLDAYLWREGGFDLTGLVRARGAEGFKAAPCSALIALEAGAVVDKDVHPPRAFAPKTNDGEGRGPAASACQSRV